MGRDVVGLVALDLLLGVVRRGVMDVPLIIEILRVDGDDGSRHPARLGIPANMVADLEPFGHRVTPSPNAARASNQ
jgi:hypothetical protein